MVWNWMQTTVTVLGFLISGIFAVWRMSWVVRGMKEDTKSELKESLETHAKDEEIRRVNIYRRLDEYKVLCEQKFVCKDVCNVMHQETANSVGKIEKKLDDFIIRIEAKLDRLVSEIKR